jgi:hypothetical protein
MRLLLILLVAGAASFLIGMTANTLAALMRCHGEGSSATSMTPLAPMEY